MLSVIVAALLFFICVTESTYILLFSGWW